MSKGVVSVYDQAQFLLQRIALGVFAGLALVLLGASLGAAFGVVPWVELDMAWNGAPVPRAGMYAQIGLLALCLSLCFFLPTNGRVLALERTHRTFSMSMEDVARAYYMAHQADREGAFRLSSEFEAMRVRMEHLRAHPDLTRLEPALLEVAAKMAVTSQDLADTYSEQNVARARLFLQQRQEEVERMKVRLAEAQVLVDELAHWLHDVETEERIASMKLTELCDALLELLPELDIEPARPERIKLVQLSEHKPAQ